MEHFLSKVLDAILANVELTIVTSTVNISKTAWGSPGSFQLIKSLYICIDDYQKWRKSNHGNSRYLILNIVNIFRLESTRRGESTNFKHQNSIESNVYLRDFCRYHQIFISSTTTLEILQYFFRFIFRRMQIFLSNSADNTMENRAISLVESSRDNSLIACRASSDFIGNALLWLFQIRYEVSGHISRLLGANTNAQKNCSV
jgi:hypothetical protein